MSEIISVTEIDIEKFRSMSEKKLHQQPSRNVFDAAYFLNQRKGNFYSSDILEAEPYRALSVLLRMK